MLTLETLTQFVGWCLAINVGIYAITVLSLTFMRNVAYKLSSSMLDVSLEEAKRGTFAYVANYKLAIIVLCMVPYIALKMMA